MATRRYRVSLRSIGREIRKKQNELRAIRGRVSRADQKRIDLRIRALDVCHRGIAILCSPEAGAAFPRPEPSYATSFSSVIHKP